MQEALPEVWVSAADAAAAAALITELLGCEGEGCAGEGGARVWRVRNKYYSARVRVRPAPATVPAPDGAPAQAPAQSPDGHIVHLAQHEVSGEWLERRVSEAGAGGAAVRVALCEGAEHEAGAEAEAALRAAARAGGYEVVWTRRAEAGEEEAEAGEECGVERVRAALHAHTWRNMRRHNTRTGLAGGGGGEVGVDSSGSEEESDAEEEPGPEDEACLERMSEFATALGAVRGARAAGWGGGGGGGPAASESLAEREARRARAEHVLGALCRALGGTRGGGML